MKICFPVQEKNGLAQKIYQHFGSAPFFIIYDTETKNFQTVENSNQHHSHGACHPLGIISQFKVDAVITSGMGKRAVQLLNEAGIKVFLSAGDSVEDALRKSAANDLVELTPANACGHHGCH